MQKIFKLSDSETLTVDVNINKKVNIKIGDEEVNFFLGNPQFNSAEMEYMNNFLMHRLASSLAFRIYNEIGAIVGYLKKEAHAPATNTDLFGNETVNVGTKRKYPSNRKYKFKHYYIRVYDKKWNVVFERTNMFHTQAEAKQYAMDVIKETGVGMKSRITVKKS